MQHDQRKDDVIRGHRMTDLESAVFNMPEPELIQYDESFDCKPKEVNNRMCVMFKDDHEYYGNMIKMNPTFSESAFTVGHPYRIIINDAHLVDRLFSLRSLDDRSRFRHYCECGIYGIFIGYSEHNTEAMFRVVLGEKARIYASTDISFKISDITDMLESLAAQCDVKFDIRPVAIEDTNKKNT